VVTAYHDLSDLEVKRVYVQCAVFAARKVLHLAVSPKAEAAIVAAERWLADSSESNRAAAATYAAAYAAYAADDDAADDAAYAAAAYAAYAAAYAAYAAAYAAYAADDDAAYAAYASAYAAYAAYDDAADDAAYAAAAAAYASYDGRDFRISLAREIIDLFKTLTRVNTTVPDASTVNEAIRNMQTVSA
jgi:hypothetical protein